MTQEIRLSIELLVLVLFTDFIILSIIRILKFPDYAGHILTGFFLTVISPYIQNIIPFTFYQFIHLGKQIEILVSLGLFFFFFEFGFQLELKKVKKHFTTDWPELLYYSVIAIVFILAAGYFFLLKDAPIVQIIFLPVALLAPDISGVITGKFFSIETLKFKFGSLIDFSFSQEIVAVIAFITLSTILSIRIPPLTVMEPVYFAIVLSLFSILFLARRWNKLEIWFSSSPVFLIFTAIAIYLVSILIDYNISLITIGIFSGFLLRLIMDKSRISFSFSIFRITRFFLIFPLIAFGGLLYSPGVEAKDILIRIIVILLLLMVLSLLMGLFWFKNKNPFLAPSISLTYRGELTFLFLINGYLENWINREILIAVFAVSFFLLIVARLGMVYRLQKYSEN